ncbi:MAG TPA: hypothetical protein VF604_05910 [Pyrinomonadaceae bacterium]|jgi:hypothetical protein
MYSINILSNIKRMAIILSLAFGVVLISDISAQAQYRKSRQTRVYISREYSRDYNTREYTDEGMNVAEQYGYEDGLQDGADAGRERDAYHPENSGDWQKGTNGYEDRFGSKKAYRQAYREAYLEGYREGYRRYTGRTYTNARNYRKSY